MTTTSGTPRAIWSPGEPTQPNAATVSGDITALNPADGLFLRAEHLRTIETYARSLTLALGIGVGTGVVYGFDLSLDTDAPALHVLPGLAVSPVGQPMRAGSPATVSLATSDLEPIGPNGFWVVEVVPAWWPFGDDKVFGNLCDEPCSGSGSLQPWIAEGVTVRLRADDMPGLAQVGAIRRRNWLASAYFERERRLSDPWLTPAAGPAAVPSLSSRAWAKGIGEPLQAGVPIGIVQLLDNTWMLDTWTARRDIGDAPADRAWRSRLAMRPWNVYIAQILQFQDMLAPLLSAEPMVTKLNVVDERDKPTEEFITKMQGRPVARWSDFKDFVAAYRGAAAPYVLASEEQSLYERGFDELPPAGFLSAPDEKQVTLARLTRLFGPRVDLRICHARADAIATVVEEARDLDRIPLQSDLVEKVGVDILVPDIPADLPGTSCNDYGWVAFVRRRVLNCDTESTQTDIVQVYAYYTGAWSADLPDSLNRMFEEGKYPGNPIGQLEYPAGSWEYPGGEVVLDLPAGNPVLGILSVATLHDRAPLMALRGHLLAASLSDQSAPIPQATIEAPKTAGEAIVVVLQVQIN